MNQGIEEKVYLVMMLIVGCASILGCVLLIFEFVKARPESGFALKLLAILSFSNLIYVISNLMDVNPVDDNALCKIQAFLKQFSGLSTFIVTFFLCYTTYLSVVEGSDVTETKYTFWVKILSLPFPLVLSIIPLFYHGYGLQNYECSFVDQNYYWISSLLLFYVPFVCLMIGNAYFLWRTFKFLREVQNTEKTIQARITLVQNISQIEEGEKYTYFLMGYIIVHIVCWSWFLIYEILYLILDKEIWILGGLRYVFACLQGLLNCILFYWSKKGGKKVLNATNLRASMQSELDHSSLDIYRGSIAYPQSNL